jgi:acyl-CoA synthetase (AMP-forming)/AMP-acid ligase II
VPDPALGNRLVASVARRNGALFDPEVLRAFCQERLPLYMVPHAVEVRDELPRTSTGKADRTALTLDWSQRLDGKEGGRE